MSSWKYNVSLIVFYVCLIALVCNVQCTDTHYMCTSRQHEVPCPGSAAADRVQQSSIRGDVGAAPLPRSDARDATSGDHPRTHIRTATLRPQGEVEL